MQQTGVTWFDRRGPLVPREEDVREGKIKYSKCYPRAHRSTRAGTKAQVLPLAFLRRYQDLAHQVVGSSQSCVSMDGAERHMNGPRQTCIHMLIVEVPKEKRERSLLVDYTVQHSGTCLDFC